MRRILFTGGLLVIVAGLGWWFFQTAPPPAASIPTVVAATKTTAAAATAKPASLSATPSVEAPKATAAPLAPGVDARDPQENLDTAIADVARLAQANDFLTLFATYGAPVIDPTLRNRSGVKILDGLQQNALQFQAYLQSPDGAAERQRMQDQLAYMKTQTPVYNEAHDRATLQVGPQTEQMRAANLYIQITFVKKDGRWYMQSGNPFGW